MINVDEEVKITIKDIDVGDLIPNVYDDVIINIKHGKHVLDIPSEMGGISFNNWVKTRGGMFNKDVLRWKRKKPHAKYVLIEGAGLVSIVRLIDEEELLLFETLKLVDGKLKDKPYMLFKTVSIGSKLTTTERYIKEKNPFMEETDVSDPQAENDVKKSLEPHSITLFED